MTFIERIRRKILRIAHLRSFLLSLVVIITISACGLTPSTEKPKEMAATEWQFSTPEVQGMDSARLVDMLTTIQDQGIHLHSLVIVRNGTVVLEVYTNPYGPEDRHEVASITKSVIGTLIGIAIDQGKIKGTDQKLVDFFPQENIQHLDEQKKSITIQNLLSMTPGLDCLDQTASAEGMYQTSKWIPYLLDLPVTTEPGTKWIYCSGASHLLSGILQKTTGQDARSFANDYLFTPLGIPEITPMDWPTDPQGYSNGVAGLYLTPREMAKFGELYLNGGKWNGQQIVSSAWIAESTREQAFIGKDSFVGGLDRRFGYMWSIFPDLGYYGYLGRSGQELFVLPDQNMVIAFTASLPIGKEVKLLDLVNQFIIPSVISDQPIKENPSANQKLDEVVRSMANPIEEVTAMPPLAAKISGRTYKLNANPAGWKDMTLLFEAGSNEAILRLSGAPDLKIGLDHMYRVNEAPDARSIALRGYWNADEAFVMDYLVLGDAKDSVGTFRFEGDRMELNIINLIYDGMPLRFTGTAQSE